MCERGAEPRPQPGGSIAGLRDAVDSYACRPRGGTRAADQVRDELRCLRRLIDRLELETAFLVGELECCGEEAWQGYSSPSAWVRHECKTLSSTAWSALSVAHQAGHLLEGIAAVEAGEIGFDHLAVIAQTAERLAEAPGQGAGFDEGFLVERARVGSVADLRRDCAHVRHAWDPRGFLREQVEQKEARFLELRTSEGGGLWLRGFLDGEGGVMLRTTLEPLAKREGAADPRDLGRRQADALVELCEQTLDAGALPRQGTQRPHLQVTVSLDALLGEEGSPAAELEGGVPVAAETARRLGCDAVVSRVVFGPGSAVVDVGRATRVIPAATRRALVARDRGCVWPGCGRPARRCEGHHVRHWARGGGTDLSNLALLCKRHHFWCHELGWTLVRTAEGVRAVAPLPHGMVPPSARSPDPVPSG